MAKSPEATRSPAGRPPRPRRSKAPRTRPKAAAGAAGTVPAAADEPHLKARLVRAARDLLERDGLPVLSLRAAARASGVSHMAPYRHFDNKDELLAAVAEQGFLALAAAMDQVLPPTAAAGAAQQTAAGGAGQWPAIGEGAPGSAVGVAYVLFAVANPALYRLMFGAGLAPHERFPALEAAGREAFGRCLQAARLAGHDCANADCTAADAPPPLVAVAMWAMVHGLASLAIDGLIELPADPAARAGFIAAVLSEPLLRSPQQP
jgi:AcrR family transcriptional regulator